MAVFIPNTQTRCLKSFADKLYPSSSLENPSIGLAGTHCVSGSAIGIVVATGDNSVFGRVSLIYRAVSCAIRHVVVIMLREIQSIACQTDQYTKRWSYSTGEGNL
jgi:magnesium-transporting ATPase (P-type)